MMMKCISFFCCCFFAFLCFANSASADINIITPTVYEQIMDSIDVSDSDLKKYKNIFKAISNNDFKTADALIEKLDNYYLMGWDIKTLLPYKYNDQTDKFEMDRSLNSLFISIKEDPLQGANNI